MPTKTINGAAAFYEDSGKGSPPLVLIHGFPLDSRIFADQASALSSDRRVIRPDLRGFGKSQSSAPFTVASLADDVHALLKDIGALPCVLGGLSMGGYVALAFAKKYATDLKGLILIDTRSEGDTADGKAGRDKMIESLKTGGAKVVADQMFPKMIAPQNQGAVVGAKARQIMESQRPETIERALVALRDREDYTSLLPSIATPTLILVGKHDAITPPDVATRMKVAIPGSTLIVIADAGHLSTMEQPQAVTEAIREFLS
jgi:pimeloyl-ACP methyl ester carboxylesterase